MSDIPETMRALVQKHDGFEASLAGMHLEAAEPYVEPAEVPVPKPSPGEVLVKVSIAAVNPSDVAFLKGVYGQPREKGRPAGFEGVGTVVASGGGFMANRLKGKRVAFVNRRAGSWAPYTSVEAIACIPLRKDVRDEDGAAMIVNPLTAYAMIGIVKKEGAKSFVMSAAASQLCKLLAGIGRDEGYRPIALVRRAEQVDLLKQHGAAHVLDITAPDFDARLAEVMKQEKPRIFLDAVTGPLGGKVFKAMGRKARWIVYGRMDVSETVIPEPGELIFMSKGIEGFWLTRWMLEASILAKIRASNAVQKRFASGTWKTDVTATLTIDEAMQRLPDELQKPNGKVYIRPA